jgi:pyridoxal phosphate enzyme (YggS family)
MATLGPMTEAIESARDAILDRIASAAARVQRDPADVEVVAITKTVPPERIRAAIEAGFRTLGENRVQERQAKAAHLRTEAPRSARDAANGSDPGADAPAPARDPAPGQREAAPSQESRPRWHLVGPLQSNKARRAVELFDVIETVDSIDLAGRLGRIAIELRPGRPMPVLLQVNVDLDAAKSGFEPAVLEQALPAILDVPGLSVAGLMTVGRLVDDPEAARPTFAALRRLSERLRERDARLGPALSMGMSQDYPVAVEEGATLVRIGSAIFGARPTG